LEAGVLFRRQLFAAEGGQRVNVQEREKHSSLSAYQVIRATALNQFSFCGIYRAQSTGPLALDYQQIKLGEGCE
jgi:hypothetical protein